MFERVGCMEIGSCNALISVLARNGFVNDASKLLELLVLMIRVILQELQG